MATERFSSVILVSVIVLSLALVTMIPGSFTGAGIADEEIVKYNPELPCPPFCAGEDPGLIPLNVSYTDDGIIDMNEIFDFSFTIRPKGLSLITNVNVTDNAGDSFVSAGSNVTTLSNTLWGFSNQTTVVSWINTTHAGLFNNDTNETFNINFTFPTNGVEGQQNTYAIDVMFNDTTTGTIVTNTTTITLTIDDRKPPIVTSNTATGTVKGIIQINVTATDAGTGVQNVTYRYENSTVNGSWTNMTNLNGNLWNGTFNTSTIADGTYNFRVNASDAADIGNYALFLIEGLNIQNQGANGGLGAKLTIVSPENFTWHNSNFLINVSINDTAGTVINSSYRYENTTVNGSWVFLYNLTGVLWNDTFDASTVGDGNYTFRYNVSTTSGTNASVIETIFIDTINPLITGFNTAKPSLIEGESLVASNFACSAIDNGTTYGGYLNYTVTGIDNSGIGLHTATCNYVDAAGNKASATVNYTVNLRSEVPEGAPGGGTASRFFGAVQRDRKYVFNDIQDDVGLLSVEFVLNVDADDLDLRATRLKAADVLKKEIPIPPGQPYSYTEIFLDGVETEGIETAEIKFQVPKVWLASNSINENDIVMLRYNPTNGNWWPLNTDLTSEEDHHFNYKADTPGFSLFAIVANFESAPTPIEDVGRAIIDTITGGASFDLENGSPTKLVYIFAVLGSLMALILVYMRAFEGKLRGPIIPKR